MVDLARRRVPPSAGRWPLGITGGGDTACSSLCAALATVAGRVEQHRQLLDGRRAPGQPRRRHCTLCVNSNAADFSTEIAVTFASSLIAAPWAVAS